MTITATNGITEDETFRVFKVRGNRVRFQNRVTAKVTKWLHIASGKPEAAKKTVSTAQEATKPLTVVEEAVSAPEAVSDDLSGLTVTDLRSRAKDAGLSGYSKLRKDELIAILSAAA